MRNMEVVLRIHASLFVAEEAITPLWQRGARGDFLEDVCSISKLLIHDRSPEDILGYDDMRLPTLQD